jgi:hypothetical protein
LSAVQREVLEEFQPKFEVLEQRFAEMDAMMHALSQVSENEILFRIRYRRLSLSTSICSLRVRW